MHRTLVDHDVVERMRAAHDHARTVLGLLPEQETREAWGWRGRTLGRPVISPDGPAWLRLARAPADQTDHTFWDGSIDAEKSIPQSMPRPRLQAHHDWRDEPWKYRAELYNRVAAQPVAATPLLQTVPTDLPTPWWTALRTALDDITAVPTERFTINQCYLDWAMPRFLGAPIDATAPHWSTAHGDLHWANLCAPTLYILDWEGWGLAPTAYDAAMLAVYSMLVPAVEDQVRQELAPLLHGSHGRFAELVVIAELLHSTTRGENHDLAASLRHRAKHLLGRPPA